MSAECVSDPSPSLASISNISVGSLISTPSARRLLIVRAADSVKREESTEVGEATEGSG